jgi:hypothetical protein
MEFKEKLLRGSDYIAFLAIWIFLLWVSTMNLMTQTAPLAYDATDEVVALCDKIRQEKEALDSITQAIKDFVDVVGGFSVQVLEDKHAAARRNLNDNIVRHSA